MHHETQALLRQRTVPVEELISNRHSITMASRKERPRVLFISRCSFMRGVAAPRRRKGRADAQLRGTVGS